MHYSSKMGVQEENIQSWSKLRDNGWDTLLLANGFSCAVSSKFSYDDLIENADHDPSLQAILDACGSRDFEVGLDSMEHALKVLRALVSVSDPDEQDAQRILDRLHIDELKSSLRSSLIRAVHKSHPASGAIPRWVLEHTAQEILRYRDVFTTNYDLILYWSLMAGPEGKARFADFFLPSSQFSFNKNSADWLRAQKTSGAGNMEDGKTYLHYLHGALHLRQGVDGKTEKLRTPRTVVPPGESFIASAPEPNLLRVITDKWAAEPQMEPLFVSEGNSKGKLQKIKASEYLSWCLNQLEQGPRKTVIFGSGFHDQDNHIWDALKVGSDRVAVSIRRGDSAQAPDKGQQCATIRAKLYGRDVDFFWADTHPLGDPRRAIETDGSEVRPPG